MLCITHLPQIAAMADTHFEIEKHVEGTETITQIHPLEGEESVRELARLLGGAQITPAVLGNAREMKELAQQTKKYKTEIIYTLHTKRGRPKGRSSFLTESSQSPASVAKSNKQWVGICLYQKITKDVT